ncbi:MAG TPA: hypothetical protein VN647_07305 [Nitrospira sp.]|nr:hypothetical protein [Nitrospira sp.]
MKLAYVSASICSATRNSLLVIMKSADPESKPNPNPSDSGITLETIISVGVVGWLAIGMVLMALGIW